MDGSVTAGDGQTGADSEQFAGQRSGGYVGPVVTVDVVLFRLPADPHAELEVLVLRRADEPFAGMLALPGVYVQLGETLADGSVRALAKAGMPAELASGLWHAATFDAIGRDPRGHALSVVRAGGVFGVDAGDAGALFVPVQALPPLAFDHGEIVADAQARLAVKSRGPECDEVFVSLLGPPPWPTGSLARCRRAVTGAEVDLSNLSRILTAAGFSSAPGPRCGAGRPAKLWTPPA